MDPTKKKEGKTPPKSPNWARGGTEPRQPHNSPPQNPKAPEARGGAPSETSNPYALGAGHPPQPLPPHPRTGPRGGSHRTHFFPRVSAPPHPLTNCPFIFDGLRRCAGLHFMGQRNPRTHETIKKTLAHCAQNCGHVRKHPMNRTHLGKRSVYCETW